MSRKKTYIRAPSKKSEEILPHLRVGVSVAEIMEIYNLSRRTAYRYLEDLESLGYEIYKCGVGRWSPYLVVGYPETETGESQVYGESQGD